MGGCVRACVQECVGVGVVVVVFVGVGSVDGCCGIRALWSRTPRTHLIGTCSSAKSKCAIPWAAATAAASVTSAAAAAVAVAVAVLRREGAEGAVPGWGGWGGVG